MMRQRAERHVYGQRWWSARHLDVELRGKRAGRSREGLRAWIDARDEEALLLEYDPATRSCRVMFRSPRRRDEWHKVDALSVLEEITAAPERQVEIVSDRLYGVDGRHIYCGAHLPASAHSDANPLYGANLSLRREIQLIGYRTDYPPEQCCVCGRQVSECDAAGVTIARQYHTERVPKRRVA